MFSKPPIVDQVRYILIIFCVFLFSLTLISCATSDDDKTSSTSSISGTSEHLYEVIYGNGIFVTVGDKGTIITSSNGTHWKVRTSGTSKYLWGITYGNGLFVTVGRRTIFTSSDGTSWTKINSGTSRHLRGITYGNGLFVTVGEDGIILTSSNGTSWTQRTSGTSEYLNGVTYSQ